jgi:hypothetical protein
VKRKPGAALKLAREAVTTSAVLGLIAHFTSLKRTGESYVLQGILPSLSAGRRFSHKRGKKE